MICSSHKKIRDIEFWLIHLFLILSPSPSLSCINGIGSKLSEDGVSSGWLMTRFGRGLEMNCVRPRTGLLQNCIEWFFLDRARQCNLPRTTTAQECGANCCLIVLAGRSRHKDFRYAIRSCNSFSLSSPSPATWFGACSPVSKSSNDLARPWCKNRTRR